MNTENLEILNRNLLYLGFGENTLLNRQLEENIAKGTAEFELYTDAFFEQFVRTEARLHFVRLAQQGIYILDRYTAVVQYEENPAINKERTFPVYKGTGVTLKEAYNLLDGRAAMIHQRNRDEEIYRIWVQLDFEERDTHQNYRFKYYRYFDLEKVLEKYPIEEYQAEATRKMLLASLERGNRHLVTLNAGKPEPKWIEANPAERTIRISAPAPLAKKRGSDERRAHSSAQTAKRVSRTTPEPAGEKTAKDQELAEDTVLAPGK